MKEKCFKKWWWLVENHEWAVDHLIIEIMKPKKKIEYWLEGGPMVKDKLFGNVWSHDIRLDCGADTFEEAVIKYANLVKKYYGEESDMIYGKKVKVPKQN
jgi:hypothetical protein